MKYVYYGANELLTYLKYNGNYKINMDTIKKLFSHISLHQLVRITVVYVPYTKQDVFIYYAKRENEAKHIDWLITRDLYLTEIKPEAVINNIKFSIDRLMDKIYAMENPDDNHFGYLVNGSEAIEHYKNRFYTKRISKSTFDKLADVKGKKFKYARLAITHYSRWIHEDFIEDHCKNLIEKINDWEIDNEKIKEREKRRLEKEIQDQDTKTDGFEGKRIRYIPPGTTEEYCDYIQASKPHLYQTKHFRYKGEIPLTPLIDPINIIIKNGVIGGITL